MAREEKEAVTFMIGKSLLEKVDELVNEAGVSRSAFLCDMVELGLAQHHITQRIAANRYMAKALHLIFGDRVFGAARRGELSGPSAPKAQVEIIRRKIIAEVKKLSLETAKAEIDYCVEEMEAGEGVRKRKDGPATA